MVHFGIKGVAEVVAERRNVVQEKSTGRVASSRRFVRKIDDLMFFGGRCNAGVLRMRYEVHEMDTYSGSMYGMLCSR